MTADLTPAQAARLEAIEAAPFAEEACVERVARALFDAANPIVESFPDYWERVRGGDETREHYRRLAVAAIDVMRGAADDGAAEWQCPSCGATTRAQMADQDDGAIGRVLALADELDTEASECKDLGRRYREGDKWTGAAVCDAKSWTSKDAAARIRAAAGAPATTEGDGWTQVAPGYWRRDEPIDERAAKALMEERLAERHDRGRGGRKSTTTGLWAKRNTPSVRPPRRRGPRWLRDLRECALMRHLARLDARADRRGE